MKKILLILAFFNLQFSIFNKLLAQAPQAIPYQAVARDNAGNPIASQAVSLRFTIHDATAGGTIVYRETQSKTTSALGLFTANIGEGTVVSGAFATINWGAGSKFMQVEMDAAGGTAYTDMGTQQMLSVPYSLFAEKMTAIADPINAGSNNTPSSIPDNNCTGITSTITVSGQAASVNTASLSVTLDITHTYDGDLFIYLIAPNGSVLCLANGNGGSGQNFTNTIFSDAGQANISTGTAPFSGTYKPNGSLAVQCSTTPTVSTFASIGGGTVNPNGTWSLKIVDQADVDVGTLNSWSISLVNPVTGSTANYVPKWNSSSSFAPSSIFDNGNVGIGTTTPSTKLEVNGQVKITGGTPGVLKLEIRLCVDNYPRKFSNCNGIPASDFSKIVMNS